MLGRLLVLSGRAFLKDDGPSWAAAIAYYSLLSIFPLLLAAGSIASYFIDAQWAVSQALELLGNFIPKGEAQIESIVKNTLDAGRGGGLLFILPLLWTGTLVFGAIARGLNAAFEVEDSYGFLKRALVRLVMLLTLGLVFLLALSSSLLLRLLQSALGFLPAGSGFITAVVVHGVPVVLVLLAFALVYRFVPARRPCGRAALVGAVVATAVFFAAQPLFLSYVESLAQHNVVYGSLAGVVAAVVWAWLVAMIGLYGGELASHSESVLFKGEPIADVERRHLADRPSGESP